MRSTSWTTLATVLIGFALTAGAHGAEIKAGGTGASLGMLRQLGAAFAQTNSGQVTVLPSLGSGGGIKAAAHRAIDVAVSVRPLKPGEDATLTQTIIGYTPFVLVSSHPRPGSLARTAVAGVIAGQQTTWPDGAPIKLVVRPEGESDAVLLGELFPGAEAALGTARKRREVPVASTDQDNAELAQSVPGSFAAMTLTQYVTEARHLSLIAIDDVTPDLKVYRTGKYPYGRPLYLMIAKDATQATRDFVAFLRSPAGQAKLLEAGIVPLEQATRSGSDRPRG
jgi:phosphate transport system substrate-binding protein